MHAKQGIEILPLFRETFVEPLLHRKSTHFAGSSTDESWVTRVMDLNAKKAALRLFSNGVYIITSRDGDKFGAATVTWISQASFKPPLIMAAIQPESNVFKCLARSGVAAIHIVDSSQTMVAQHFFTPTCAASGTINGEPYRDGNTSAPILTTFAAHVECRVRRIIDGGGDHALILMEVHEAECRGPVKPLIIRESPWHYGG